MWTARPIRHLKSFWRAIAGASAVEFGFAAPLLLALVFGVIEIGRALQHQHVLVKGVRDAGRYLGRVPITCPGGGVGAGAITNAVNLASAKNLAMNGAVAGGQPVLSYWTDPNTITVAVDCLDNSAGANLCGAAPCRPSGSGDVAIITVSADLAYQDLGFMALFGGAPFAFTVSHEEYSIGE